MGVVWTKVLRSRLYLRAAAWRDEVEESDEREEEEHRAKEKERQDG